MRENLKLDGYALNVEYFSEILHIIRTIPDYAKVVNSFVDIPKNADTRDTKAIIKISTGFLKLLFPHVRNKSDISKEDFETYCLYPAMEMRKIIRKQISLIDSEFHENLPEIKVK